MLVINDDSVLQREYHNYYLYRITKHNVTHFIEKAKKQSINLKHAEKLKRKVLHTGVVAVMLRKRMGSNEIILDFLYGYQGYALHEYKPHKIIKYNKAYIGGSTIKK